MRTRFFSRRLKKLLSIAAATLVVTAAVFLATSSNSGQSHALAINVTPDYSTNSIIFNGAPSTAAIQSAYNSDSKVRTVYSHYGISASDIASIGSTAVAGYTTKSGDVIVNGKVVATGAHSAGYHKQTGSTEYSPGGVTFYDTANANVFLSNTISGYVVMVNGVFKYMILASCGNPLTATPTTTPPPPPPPAQPVYACDSLHVTHVGNFYVFETNLTASNGATVNKVVHDFGDGSPLVTSSGSQHNVEIHYSANHTYTSPGTYPAKSIAYFNLPGGKIVAVTGGCQYSVTIPPVAPPPPPPPPTINQGYAACSYLNATKGSSPRSYDFTVSTDSSSVKMARLTGASFNYGDGSTPANVGPATSLSAQSSHTYAKDGSYTVTATMYYDVDTTTNGRVTSTSKMSYSCSTPISFVTPPEECKPGVPVGSPKCETSTMQCLSLTLGQPGRADAYGNTRETLIASAKAKNATINSYSFNFDDGSQPYVVKTDSSTASVSHTYAPGSYNPAVTVSMTDAYGDHVITSANCQANFTITAPNCVPGSTKPECVPCKYNPNIPSNSVECQPPTPTPTPPTPPAPVLPDTGPGSIVALFAGTTGLGTIGHWFYRRRKYYS